MGLMSQCGVFILYHDCRGIPGLDLYSPFEACPLLNNRIWNQPIRAQQSYIMLPSHWSIRTCQDGQPTRKGQ